jgi:hypothetical protein
MTERTLLPSKEQIAAVAEADDLSAMLETVENGAISIETQLEHRGDDGATEEWERRAQGALVAHRICAKHLRAEIHRRRLGKPKPTGAKPEGASQAKAANKATAELAAANALERRRQGLEVDRLNSLRSAKKLLDRMNFDHLWRNVAGEFVDAGTLREITTEANRRWSARGVETLEALIDTSGEVYGAAP